jgi:hypothetical protein
VLGPGQPAEVGQGVEGARGLGAAVALTQGDGLLPVTARERQLGGGGMDDAEVVEELGVQVDLSAVASGTSARACCSWFSGTARR